MGPVGIILWLEPNYRDGLQLCFQISLTEGEQPERAFAASCPLDCFNKLFVQLRVIGHVYRTPHETLSLRF